MAVAVSAIHSYRMAMPAVRFAKGDTCIDAWTFRPGMALQPGAVVGGSIPRVVDIGCGDAPMEQVPHSGMDKQGMGIGRNGGVAAGVGCNEKPLLTHRTDNKNIEQHNKQRL